LFLTFCVFVFELRSVLSICLFLFRLSTHLLVLLSLPTRRSSDLHFTPPLTTERPCNKIERNIRFGRRISTSDASPIQTKCARFRSEEHTSELQSRFELVCRLLLEKKKYKTSKPYAALTVPSQQH